ncbi:AbrB/MazE/SpoVT family DNA-binding domain-containing protein [Paludicola sp. MB14-C6]|uniref:AbrB/MazE/SpoVT family DNA-binding domain-containing protein n=1 Tax=Paludihabitans sp. MB14-C6 TaxID=3070656 RepID=UPI0027DDF204|nr:AbrB/MazE/SpoVT family DNA-binding domain-containing protein [Paludicola sp. MB14-C6]WMJ22705.1 AbrB/MazE/SpoVT family DNA-binding domain-containing protein [Paludicola sp. MB14-C6]
MERKIISISQKRQITIPQKYFEALGFDNEAECIYQNNTLIIRPIKDNIGGEFAEQILADLISQGYSGNELLKQFKIQQSKVCPAIEQIITNAEDAAKGKD